MYCHMTDHINVEKSFEVHIGFVSFGVHGLGENQDAFEGITVY